MEKLWRTDYAGPITTQRLNLGGTNAPVAIDLVRPVEPDRLLDDPAVLDLNRADDYMPYWAYVWPGAYLLAEAVTAETSLAGARMLEIGCGLGLAGLVALAKGASVTFSDYDEAPFSMIEQSVQASGFDASRVETRTLDWRRLPRDLSYPWILGADVLYEKRLVPLVANLIATLLAPGGTALLASPYRLAAEIFPAQIEALGFHCETEPITAETIDHGRIRGSVHRVRRK